MTELLFTEILSDEDRKELIRIFNREVKQREKAEETILPMERMA